MTETMETGFSLCSGCGLVLSDIDWPGGHPSFEQCAKALRERYEIQRAELAQRQLQNANQLMDLADTTREKIALESKVAGLEYRFANYKRQAGVWLGLLKNLQAQRQRLLQYCRQWQGRLEELLSEQNEESHAAATPATAIAGLVELIKLAQVQELQPSAPGQPQPEGPAKDFQMLLAEAERLVQLEQGRGKALAGLVELSQEIKSNLEQFTRLGIIF